MYVRTLFLLALALFVAGAALACGDDGDEDAGGDDVAADVRREVTKQMPNFNAGEIERANVENQELVLDTAWHDAYDRTEAAKLCTAAARVQLAGDPFHRVLVRSKEGKQLAECTP